MRCRLIPLLALAACADAGSFRPDPVAPARVVRSVTVTPSPFIVPPGQSAQLTATVDADSGVSRAVVWRVLGQSAATLSETGLVTMPPCGPDGLMEVAAVAVADTTKRGSASGTVGARFYAFFPTIDALEDSVTGAGLSPAGLHGSVRVSIRSSLPSCPAPADSIRLVVQGPAGDTTLASVPVPPATGAPFSMFWPTALTRSGRAVFPNGHYVIHAEGLRRPAGLLTGGSVPLEVANP